MSKSKPKKLSPARNGAAYPTLKDVGLDRRFLLASAAALALGLSCSSTDGTVDVLEDPRDASVDAALIATDGVAPGDASVPLDGGVPEVP